mgnify:CR=1 FL=1
MSSPYHRRSSRGFAWWQTLLLLAGVILIVLGWERLSAPSAAHPTPGQPPLAITPTLPQNLSRADVLPTPTSAAEAIPRTISFPGALLTARIINAARTADSWETRYLGDAVGHLQGTSWLDDPGGNIVLAGHVETAFGTAGPFAHLFETQPGDTIILNEGARQQVYRVVSIERADPEAMRYVAQDGRPRLTLITCDDWDNATQSYRSRLIVIAEPQPQG